MKMKRIIHAIGQGAFYTEKFYTDSNESYTIVYDCGSSTGRSIIENEIVNTFDKEKNITAIFISHFHQDHINGINKLLKHCNVKYVFLPVLTNESKLLLKAYENNKEILDFIDNPVRYIKDRSANTTVVLVDEANSDTDSNNEPQNQEVFHLNGEQSRAVESINIESGRTITFSDPNIVWEYIPYNLRHDDLYYKIESCLSSSGIDLKDTGPDNLKIIKELFNKIIKRKDKNINSMVLYSGSSALQNWTCKGVTNCRYGFCLKKCNCCYCEPIYCKNYNTGCLYLGDYDLNNAFERLIEKYDRVAHNISLVQVPHHGSIHNFNDRILDYFANFKMFFISFGKNNRYRHPSYTVIEKIIDSCNCVCLVTEHKPSAIEFEYELR